MSDQKYDEISEKSKVDDEDLKNDNGSDKDMPEYSFINPRHKMQNTPSNIAKQIRKCALEDGESEFEDQSNENITNDPIYDSTPNNEPKSDDNKNESLDEKEKKSDTKVNIVENDLNVIAPHEQARKNLSSQDSEGSIHTSSNLEEISIRKDDGDSQENMGPSCKAKYSDDCWCCFQLVFSIILILVVFVAIILLIYIFCKGKKEKTPMSKIQTSPEMSKEDYEIWINHNITVARNRFPWNPYLWLPKKPFWN